MHIPILTRFQNGCMSRQKNSHILRRNVLFEAYFRDEGHFFANYLIHIFLLRLPFFVVYACKFPSKQGLKKNTFAAEKNGCILLKEVLLKLNFKHRGHLFTNCLFYILDNYCKRCLFQFLPCGIRS